METEKKDMPNIPFIAYEYTMARFERTIKRLIAVIILLVIGLVATNALWIYEWESVRLLRRNCRLTGWRQC